MRLSGKVALVTGGYGGMGRATCQLFAREGATVFVAGRKRDHGMALVDEILSKGGQAHFVELDIVDQGQWDAAVTQVTHQAGGLHVLMNIVGSNALAKLPELDLEAWQQMFAINVTGTLRGIQAFAPLIRDSGGGSIINIGSLAGMTGNFSTAYSASKWALNGLSRSVAVNYAEWGIRCNVIEPGWINTDMTSAMNANPLMRRMQAGVMNTTVILRRGGQADEIAGPALFLASDESSYVTGTEILVDGGWFSAAPYLINERSHHMLRLLAAKDKAATILGRLRRSPSHQTH